MREQLLFFLKEVFPILLIIFVVVLSVIFLFRFILGIILEYSYKHYLNLKNFKKNKKNKKNLKKVPKEEDERFIKKENNVEIIPVAQNNAQELDEVKIVDIAKPIGFWTSMILGSKLTNIVSTAQLYNKNSKQGFWVSMIHAKERAAGRQRGRSL